MQYRGLFFILLVISPPLIAQRFTCYAFNEVSKTYASAKSTIRIPINVRQNYGIWVEGSEAYISLVQPAQARNIFDSNIVINSVKQSTRFRLYLNSTIVPANRSCGALMEGNLNSYGEIIRHAYQTINQGFNYCPTSGGGNYLAYTMDGRRHGLTIETNYSLSLTAPAQFTLDTYAPYLSEYNPGVFSVYLSLGLNMRNSTTAIDKFPIGTFLQNVSVGYQCVTVPVQLTTEVTTTVDFKQVEIDPAQRKSESIYVNITSGEHVPAGRILFTSTEAQTNGSINLGGGQVEIQTQNGLLIPMGQSINISGRQNNFLAVLSSEKATPGNANATLTLTVQVD